MANLTTAPTYDPIYQLETADDVLGGAGQIANRQAQALGDRDDYIRWLINGINHDTTDTTTLVASFPSVVSFTPANGTIYYINGNFATYNLPPIASVADGLTFHLYGQGAAYINADGSETINCIDEQGANSKNQVVFAYEIATFKKIAGDTKWTMITKNRLKPGMVFLAPNVVGSSMAPATSHNHAPCNGASASTTDVTTRRLFAVIGYAFGGAGGTFVLPNIDSLAPAGFLYAIAL